jgi:hypothetical protein
VSAMSFSVTTGSLSGWQAGSLQQDPMITS